MSHYYKLCMSVNKICTNVGRFFFSMHFKLQDEKGFSAMRSFKTMYTYSRKIQLCNQNWSCSFHMLPGTKQPMGSLCDQIYQSACDEYPVFLLHAPPV